MPPFFRLIENQPIIKNVLMKNNFLDVDFSSMEYTKEWEEQYVFNNIWIGEFLFNKIRVNALDKSVWITLLTQNFDFFDNPIFFFGKEGILYEKPPYSDGEKEVKEYARKIGSFDLHNRTVRIMLLKSDAYGVVIKLNALN